GDRSDSHLNDQDFIRCLRLDPSQLKGGGVYISDGVRQSYTRIMRMQKVAEFVSALEGTFRAFAVVDRATQYPLSVFIEKGIYQNRAYHFMPEGDLSAIFDFSKVELVPVQDVARRADIVVENAFRRRKLEKAKGNPDIFRYLKETRTKLLQILKEKCAPLYLESTDENLPVVLDILEVLYRQYSLS